MKSFFPEGPCGGPDGLRYTCDEFFIRVILNVCKYQSSLVPIVVTGQSVTEENPHPI